MRNNYSCRDIEISFICISVWRTFRNTTHFFVKELMLIMAFCLSIPETGQCCRNKVFLVLVPVETYATLIPVKLGIVSILSSAQERISATSVFNYMDGDYRPLVNNTDFSTGGSSPYSWEIFTAGAWAPTAVSPQEAKASRIMIDKQGIDGGASSANSCLLYTSDAADE